MKNKDKDDVLNDKEFSIDVFVTKHIAGNLTLWAKDKAEAESLAEESISFKIKEVRKNV